MNEDIIRLVKAVCNGDIESLAKLYSATLQPAYYLAYKLSGNRESAVDITQKAYAKAFCTVTKLKKPEAFEIWVRQNITTVYKESGSFVFDDASGDIPETAREFLSRSVISDPEKASAALAAVDALRPELRLAAVLHYYVNMPVRSVSKFLGVSESTVNALLTKAKMEIYSACGSSAPEAVPVSTSPVLTELLMSEMKSTQVDMNDMRNMFVYIRDIFTSFRENEGLTAGVGAGYSAGSSYEPSVPAAPAKTASYESDGLGSTEDRVDFDKFVDEPVKHSREPGSTNPIISKILNTSIGGRKIGSFNLKRVGLLALAVLLIFILIIAIASHAGKSKRNNDVPDSGQSTSAQPVSGKTEYRWVDGGFEAVTEMVFLDNNAAMFKSNATGKFGLIDYKGNVILQPIYDGFKRCGSGRNYAKENTVYGDESYHTLYTLNGTDYYLHYQNGVAIASQDAHSQHGYSNQILDSNLKYDERDRYYEGLAAAEKDGKWGYVSLETDKKVIPYEYEAVNSLDSVGAKSCDYCRPFTDGLAAVKKNGKMGIINTENDVIVPFEFDDILVGSDGMFIAKKDGVWGVILVGNAINSFSGINLNISADPAVNEEDAKTYICTASKGLNIRSDAGADFEDIGDLEYLQEVTGYETKTAENGNEWLRIKTDTGYGYVSFNYMQLKEES